MPTERTSGALAQAPNVATTHAAGDAAARPTTTALGDIDVDGRLQTQRLRLPDDFYVPRGGWAAVRFRLEQALLGIGTQGAPSRAWYRRFVWAELCRRSGAPRAALWVAREPFRLFTEVRRAVSRHGPTVHERHGVPLLTQFAQLYRLALVNGVHANSYYRYQLFQPDRRRRAALYMNLPEGEMLYRVLAGREARADFLVLEDKRRFERWCRTHGLPTIRTIAVFADGALIAEGPDEGADVATVLDSARGLDVFSKLVDASGGAGAHRWRWRDGGWCDAAGRTCGPQEVLDALTRQSRDGAVLLQECLVNHPSITAFATDALCTVRLLTARAPGGRPEVTSATFRMGSGDSSTDNFSITGIAADIDRATGRLGAGIRKDDGALIAPVDRHPDSGRPLNGFQLPHWELAVALGVRAHAALESIGFVGWDIALTPGGPVLVEGNVRPGSILAQAPSGQPLGETNHLRYLDEHLRHSFSRSRAR